jgi:hypothetical protein
LGFGVTLVTVSATVMVIAMVKTMSISIFLRSSLTHPLLSHDILVLFRSRREIHPTGRM